MEQQGDVSHTLRYCVYPCTSSCSSLRNSRGLFGPALLRHTHWNTRRGTSAPPPRRAPPPPHPQKKRERERERKMHRKNPRRSTRRAPTTRLRPAVSCGQQVPNQSLYKHPCPKSSRRLKHVNAPKSLRSLRWSFETSRLLVYS